MAKATTVDKTRTIEAATGQLDTEHTLQIGPWKVGYLALKNSEWRRILQFEDQKRLTDILDLAYKLFLKRFIGENPPSQEEFEDETTPTDIYVFIAWLQGVDEDEARRMLSDPTKSGRSEK